MGYPGVFIKLAYNTNIECFHQLDLLEIIDISICLQRKRVNH